MIRSFTLTAEIPVKWHRWCGGVRIMSRVTSFFTQSWRKSVRSPAARLMHSFENMSALTNTRFKKNKINSFKSDVSSMLLTGTWMSDHVTFHLPPPGHWSPTWHYVWLATWRTESAPGPFVNSNVRMRADTSAHSYVCGSRRKLRLRSAPSVFSQDSHVWSLHVSNWAHIWMRTPFPKWAGWGRQVWIKRLDLFCDGLSWLLNSRTRLKHRCGDGRAATTRPCPAFVHRLSWIILFCKASD